MTETGGFITHLTSGSHEQTTGDNIYSLLGLAFQVKKHGASTAELPFSIASQSC